MGEDCEFEAILGCIRITIFQKLRTITKPNCTMRPFLGKQVTKKSYSPELGNPQQTKGIMLSPTVCANEFIELLTGARLRSYLLGQKQLKSHCIREKLAPRLAMIHKSLSCEVLCRIVRQAARQSAPRVSSRWLDFPPAAEVARDSWKVFTSSITLGRDPRAS